MWGVIDGVGDSRSDFESWVILIGRDMGWSFQVEGSERRKA